jgi:hypothetical protein
MKWTKTTRASDRLFSFSVVLTIFANDFSWGRSHSQNRLIPGENHLIPGRQKLPLNDFPAPF